MHKITIVDLAPISGFSKWISWVGLGLSSDIWTVCGSTAES